MTAEIGLDPDSKEPPYTQIKLSIAQLIVGGELLPGDGLPPIRQLAGDLDLAPNTVARAYRDLETDGLVRSRGRRGTVVADRPSASVPPPIVVRNEIDELVKSLKSKGLDAATILRLVQQSVARS